MVGGDGWGAGPVGRETRAGGEGGALGWGEGGEVGAAVGEGWGDELEGSGTEGVGAAVFRTAAVVGGFASASGGAGQAAFDFGDDGRWGLGLWCVRRGGALFIIVIGESDHGSALAEALLFDKEVYGDGERDQ